MLISSNSSNQAIHVTESEGGVTAERTSWRHTAHQILLQAAKTEGVATNTPLDWQEELLVADSTDPFLLWLTSGSLVGYYSLVGSLGRGQFGLDLVKQGKDSVIPTVSEKIVGHSGNSEEGPGDCQIELK